MLEGLKDPNRSMHVMFLLEGASDALSAANARLNADHKAVGALLGVLDVIPPKGQ